jgi:ureidoacrylate peracid hydrolase
MIEPLMLLADKIDPAHTALVVVDMQNDFCAEGGYIHNNLGCDMSPNAPLAGRIMELVETAREANALVVWIQANYEPRYLSGQALAKIAEKQTGAICCEGGTWGYDFYEVSPAPGEPIIEKHTYSGFFGTELDRMLRFRGIKTLVMTGVATNVCVESTWRDGYFNGYYIVVPEDCVGSAAQDLHEAALKGVRMFFGEVTTGNDVRAIWADGESVLKTG